MVLSISSLFVLLSLIVHGKTKRKQIDEFSTFVLVVNPLSCFVCDSKEDEHCPETWTRKDLRPIECGGPDGVQDARFCIKTIAVFGGKTNINES